MATTEQTPDVLRLHNTRTPCSVVTAAAQRPGLKPHGLWYAFGSAWLDWCRAEQPDWIGAHTYVVELRDTARILTLGTVADVRDFADEYRVDDWRNIDWPRVAEQYDGIEFNPYHWHLRRAADLLWYYSIDVASGCVWRPEAVTIRPVE